MNRYPDNIDKTTALIYKNDSFVSSGIIFLLDNKPFVITAGHSIYGKNFEENNVIKESFIIYGNNKKNKYSISKVYGDIEFGKKHDIVLIEIKEFESIQDLLQFSFYTPPKNQSHSLMIRGKYKNNPEDSIYNFSKDISFDASLKDESLKYLINSSKDLFLHSHTGFSGEWLEGLSGSGVFYCNRDSIACTGIIIKIEDSGNAGKILCASFESLIAHSNFKIIDSSSLDFDEEFNKASILSIIESKNEKTVIDWEKKSENAGYIENINKKFKEVYPKEEILSEKVETIKDILIGSDLIENELKKYEQLYNKYREAFLSYKGTKKFYANGKKEAHEKLSEIRKEYTKFLTDSLIKIDKPKVEWLSRFGISQWISDCSINIFKEEVDG